MKKLAVLFFVMALVLPSAAPALTTETQILGTWTGCRETNGQIDFFTFRFYNDGSVVKESYTCKSRDDLDPYIFISLGKWDRIGGAVNVHTESSTGGDFLTQLFLTEDKNLALHLVTCYIILKKLPEPVKNIDIKLVDSWE